MPQGSLCHGQGGGGRPLQPDAARHRLTRGTACNPKLIGVEGGNEPGDPAFVEGFVDQAENFGQITGRNRNAIDVLGIGTTGDDGVRRIENVLKRRVGRIARRHYGAQIRQRRRRIANSVRLRVDISAATKFAASGKYRVVSRARRRY